MRKVIQPLKLSDGTVLPVGTLLATDTQNAVFNNSSLDDPHKFDGFRFEKLRAQEGNSMKYQVSLTPPPSWSKSLTHAYRPFPRDLIT